MKKGFTLIELLIVIALLGTLAVALLAAIDPFEQFRKGTDTGVRNTVQEIFNAGIRYYAQRNQWPTTWYGITSTGETIDTLDPTNIITPLVNAGELKDNFIELAEGDLDAIYISRRDQSNTESHIAVCFHPESRSFNEADSNTKFTSPNYNTTGYYGPISDTGTECRVNSGSTECYWCIY